MKICEVLPPPNSYCKGIWITDRVKEVICLSILFYHWYKVKKPVS